MKNLLLFFLFVSSFVGFSQSPILVETLNNKDGDIIFRYTKDIPGTYVLVLYFTELENALHSETNYTIQEAEDTLFVLNREDPRKEIKQKFKFYYLMANPNPVLSDTMIYEPPVEKNSSVRVGIVTNLSRASDDGESKPFELVSFVGDKPFNALAAKDGTVVKVVKDFPTNTMEEFRIKNRINYVVIEHEDGTYTKYKGLKDDSVTVEVGDIVRAGDLLGTADYYDVNMKAVLIFEPFYWELVNPGSRSVKPKDRYASHYIRPYFNVNGQIRSLAEGSTFNY